MATIRVYIQPRFPAATSQLAFYDFSKHVDFTSMEWENNDQGTQSMFNASFGSIMPTSTTSWMDYPGATEADKIQNALNDDFFHLKIYPRTEIQVRDISTSPHTILWGGIVTRTEEAKDGGAISGSIEAIDYTELLNESVALEYTAAAGSTIKQVITSETYSFTVTNAERTDNIVTLTVTGTPTLGTPYSRELGVGDSVIVTLDDATYNGIHAVTAVTSSGANTIVKFVQYGSQGDSASAPVTGTAKIYGFLTTDNAPGLDSRIRVQAANIYDLNPDYKFSPKSQGTIRTIQTVARADALNPYRATITTSAVHPYAVGQRVTISLTSGPTNYATLNGTWTVYSTPTSGTFTVDTDSNLTITSGAVGVGSKATGDGIVSPTPIKGGTLRANLDTVVSKGTGVFYLNSGVIDGGGSLDIDLYVRAKDQVDLVTNGLFESGLSTGWTLGSWLVDSVGNTGPFGVGNTIYYTGSDHQDAEMAPASRITVVAGEKYFVSWRHYSEKDAKEKPRIKFYDAGGAVVGNAHGEPLSMRDPINDEWHRDFGIFVVPSSAVKASFVLHHESFSSSYTARFTDIQIIKLTGAFGFSDHPLEDTTTYSYDLRDFENPSAPSESGETSNRIYIYAPYTTEDELTGAKQITNYRNTYDFVQGVWEAGGKRIEASQVSTDATTSELARLTAQKFFKERGQTLRSFEFEHISGPLNVGDVVPFIWDELGVAEALVVRKQVGYMIGDSVFYRVQLGGDMAFQRNTMYLVEQKLAEITGKTTVTTPVASPYPGTPTAGGVVTPGVPILNAGTGFVGVSWRYPESTLKSESFGGFIVLRSADAGNTWYKVSTQEQIQAAANPLSPDTMITEYGDSQVSNTEQYTYKIAAIDVSGNESIITEYSTVSAQAQPSAFPGGQDITEPYTGLGVNVPKVVYALTEGGNKFVVESGDPLTALPDAQYPPGQFVFAQNTIALDGTGTTIESTSVDAKIYRVSVSNTFLRAAIDKIDVSSDGTVAIAADRIATGTLDAGIINVTNLNVSSLRSGDISLVADNDDNLSEISFKDEAGEVVSRWNSSGLTIFGAGALDENGLGKRVYISDGSIKLINGEGTETAAISGDGINASSITLGQLPGGSNSIPNSSFELAAFGTPVNQSLATGYLLNNVMTTNNVSPQNTNVLKSGTISGISSTGTLVTYTATNTFAVDDYVTISGVLPVQYNLENVQITARTSGSFTVASTASGSYVSSSGIAYRDQIELTAFGW
jgi:hypothetical protein